MDHWAENLQDNIYNYPLPWLGYNVGSRRSHPQEMPFVEFDPTILRWRRGLEILPHFRSKKYLTRPHDGKRPGRWGRLKDALTGEGADVFVTISGDKRTLMRDRPQHREWTGWPETQQELRNRMLYDKDFRVQDLMPLIEANHTLPARARKPVYDFNRRKFLSESQASRNPWTVMTKAQWPQGARRDEAIPWTSKDIWGINHSRVPFGAGHFPGGRPRF